MKTVSNQVGKAPAICAAVSAVLVQLFAYYTLACDEAVGIVFSYPFLHPSWVIAHMFDTISIVGLFVFPICVAVAYMSAVRHYGPNHY